MQVIFILPSCRASTLSNAVSSLASTGMSFTKVDEREKQAALEEEQARLKALKVCPFFFFFRDVLYLKCASVLCLLEPMLSSLLRNNGLKSSPRGRPLPQRIRHRSPPPGAPSAPHQPSTSSPHPAAQMGTPHSEGSLFLKTKLIRIFWSAYVESWLNKSLLFPFHSWM